MSLQKFEVDNYDCEDGIHWRLDVKIQNYLPVFRNDYRYEIIQDIKIADILFYPLCKNEAVEISNLEMKMSNYFRTCVDRTSYIRRYSLEMKI